MIYKNHYLTSVILRVDFASPEETLKQALSAKVKNTCVKYFPIFEDRKVEERQVLVNNKPSAKNTIISTEEMSEWYFFGKEREKRLCITHSYMFVDFKEYKTFAEFKAQFFEVLDELITAYPTININRVGLRYIDQIELPTEKRIKKNWGSYWSRYLNTSLLQGLLFADNDAAITRHMSSLEMNYGEHMLRFQYGIYNEDYPAPNKKNKYILDTDIYSLGLFSVDEVKESVDSYHQQAKDWFEKSIKVPLREKMGVTEQK